MKTGKPWSVWMVEEILFNTKWILNIFYFGLISVLLVYTYTYAKEVLHLIREAGVLTADSMMLKILEVVDIVMVANLVKMIITGSYNSFVSKEHGRKNENVSSGILKVKMSTSIAGVSSIHLLRSFIDSKNVAWPEVNKQLAIHGIILIGALTLALIEYIHVKSQSLETENEKAAH